MSWIGDCWCCPAPPRDEGPQENGSNVVKHRTRGGKGAVAQANERGKRQLPRKKKRR